MTSFSELLQQGASNAWFFVPSAVLLGALHGLEPGHSKTVMAGFIIAVRGTVSQAVLLGLSATLSHTAVVWAVALIGLEFGSHWNTEESEPYFQIASAVLILVIAAWMLWRTFQDRQPRPGSPLSGPADDHHAHDGRHKDHHQDHHHDHDHEAMDAHARAHAEEIEQRFADRSVTTGQVVMFGLTGGLVPCPASITILLLCLQVKQVALGAVLVLCFSIGLALTMVAFGVVAALGVRHIGRRWSGFGRLARHAPYLSGMLISAVGLYTGYLGVAELAARGA